MKRLIKTIFFLKLSHNEFIAIATIPSTLSKMPLSSTQSTWGCTFQIIIVVISEDSLWTVVFVDLFGSRSSRG
jgi:hypothetical protein